MQKESSLWRLRYTNIPVSGVSNFNSCNLDPNDWDFIKFKYRIRSFNSDWVIKWGLYSWDGKNFSYLGKSSETAVCISALSYFLPKAVTCTWTRKVSVLSSSRRQIRSHYLIQKSFLRWSLKFSVDELKSQTQSTSARSESIKYLSGIGAWNLGSY